MSLARLASTWSSREMRSVAASIAEFNNSTINTNSTLPTINALPIPLTCVCSASGIRISASRTSTRNASSCLKVAENPSSEYKSAFQIRLRPVLPLYGVLIGNASLLFLGSGDFLVRGGIEQAGHFGEVIGF